MLKPIARERLVDTVARVRGRVGLASSQGETPPASLTFIPQFKNP
jgi:hypothetical protein